MTNLSCVLEKLHIIKPRIYEGGGIMKNKDLFLLMQNKNADQEYLDELHDELANELNKPVSEQDFDLIDDLTQTIAMITGTETLIEHKSEKS